jgi:hypothetical protein
MTDATIDLSMTEAQLDRFRGWLGRERVALRARASAVARDAEAEERRWRAGKACDVLDQLWSMLDSELSAQAEAARKGGPEAGTPTGLAHERVVALRTELATWAARAGSGPSGEAWARADEELAAAVGLTREALDAAAPPPRGRPRPSYTVSLGGVVLRRGDEEISPGESHRRIARALEAMGRDPRDRSRRS